MFVSIDMKVQSFAYMTISVMLGGGVCILYVKKCKRDSTILRFTVCEFSIFVFEFNISAPTNNRRARSFLDTFHCAIYILKVA